MGGPGGRQEVSGDELRYLADKAGQTAVDVAGVRDRVEAIIGGLDRRGWNAAAVDDQWARTRYGLNGLGVRLSQNYADLLTRAGEADQLNTWLGSPDGSWAPDWFAAPFAAGASLLGPGGVPILGPWGIVPPGYSNAGSRLWLYFGGSGTDTIFSIHPFTGMGRPPYGLPKPYLRMDYGPIAPGRAFLPDGTPVSVSSSDNYFHWNTKGGQGFSGRDPLFSSLTHDITHDHQLLSDVVPKGGMLGDIGGATLVRGASRGLFVVGAGVDAYSIATSDNKPRTAAGVAGGWAGAYAGAEGGAMLGATIGSVIPGAGTAVGGVVGGIVGGAGGYIVGSGVGKKVFDTVSSWF